MTVDKLYLGGMKKGDRALIVATGGPIEIRRRLLEMGFLEGSVVEVIHEAPFGKDPIAVRVRGTLLALRRNEANYIEVHLEVA
ncbi:MAG: ferrous iron transport protein A [Cryobacterium sp.]|nr:ferrous iron transport protein A [Oligoflexia bacterium]